MKTDKYQHFQSHCKKFVLRMREENISIDFQKAMLKAYVASYMQRNNCPIQFQNSHITELIS